MTFGRKHGCVLRSGVTRGAPSQGELVMPVWTVRMPGGEDERIEAEMLLLESGALMALSEESLVVRAWAPGVWQTVRQITGAEANQAGERSGKANALVGLPRG